MKKVLMGVMVICLVLTVGAFATLPQPCTDMRGYWPLDGNGTDASIYGNDGAIMNGPIYEGGVSDPNAVVGTALGFKHDPIELAGTREYIEIPNATQYDITDHMTLSAWIKVQPGGFNEGWQAVIARGDWSWRMARDGDPDPNGMATHFDVPVGDRGSWGGIPVNDGQWHHVCGYFKPGEFRLYIDGVSDTNRNDDADAVAPINTVGNDPVTIGAQIDSGTAPRRHWNGMIDEVAIWDRALTEAEILALYNAGTGVAMVDWRATNPSPVDDPDTLIDPVSPITLSWTAGTGIAPTHHNVYLGTDRDAVENAAPADAEFYQTVAAPTTSINIVGLTQDATYYWRVDEYNGGDLSDPNDGAKGLVWAFNADKRATILQQPENISVPQGFPAEFTVVAEGATGYQWLKDGSPLSNLAGKIEGATTSTLKVLDVQAADEADYICAVINAIGSIATDPAELKMIRLLGYWPLDGDPNDHSGYDNHGVARGTGTLTFTGGIIDQCASFGNDYLLEIPNPSHFDQANAGITVSCWINSGGNDDWEPFVSKDGETRSDIPYGWQLRKRGGDDIHTFTLRGTNGDDDPTPSPRGLFNSQWRLVVGTYDGSTRVVYLDGMPVLFVENDGSSIATTPAPVAIGGRVNSENLTEYGWYFAGLIDDVRIYDGALSPAHVAQLYYDVTGETVCYPPLEGDFTGPNGVPDCVIDLFDYAYFTARWMECGLIPVTACP